MILPRKWNHLAYEMTQCLVGFGCYITHVENCTKMQVGKDCPPPSLQAAVVPFQKDSSTEGIQNNQGNWVRGTESAFIFVTQKNWNSSVPPSLYVSKTNSSPPAHTLTSWRLKFYLKMLPPTTWMRYSLLGKNCPYCKYKRKELSLHSLCQHLHASLIQAL